MKKVLLANIGNRNIKISENILYETNILDDLCLGLTESKEFFEKEEFSDGYGFINKKYFKQITKFLSEQFDSYQDFMKTNIIDFLNYEDIILIITDQEDPKYNTQDTIYEGIILQKLNPIHNITLVSYQKNPTDRGAVFDFLEDFLKKLPKNIHYDVLGSGGVPAMKESLHFLSSNLLEHRVILDKSEKDDSINQYGFESKIADFIKKKNICNLIEHYDYVGAITLIDTLNSKKFIVVRDALLYLLHRYHFDFDSAQGYHNEFRSVTGDFIIPDYKDETFLVGELLQNIKTSFNKGEYAGVVAKIYALSDVLYKYLFEKITKVKSDDIVNLKRMNIKISKSDIGKKEYVKSYHLMEYLNSHYKKTHAEVGLTDEITNELFKIKETRNASMIAHGLGGVEKNYAEQLSNIIETYRIQMFPHHPNIYETSKQAFLSKFF